MSVEADKKALAQHRLEQAGESLDEATFLLSGEKSPRSIINRVYYAMFYAILALLCNDNYTSPFLATIIRLPCVLNLRMGALSRPCFQNNFLVFLATLCNK